MATLEPMAEDKLIELTPTQLHVKPLGRLLIRNIAMVFDAYLHANDHNRYSKVI